jgi:diacylglycerol kinase (ATP)
VARRLLVILNPAAGGWRAQRRLGRVLAELGRLGCSVDLRVTGAPGEAEILARGAGRDFDLIVAAGGDGTANEIANGLAAGGPPFALLPLGTANVLAREISLPFAPRRLAAVIAGGMPRPIWPGRADGRLFLMMAGAGFDAEIVRCVGRRRKRRFGRLAFLPAILRALGYRPAEILARADGVDYRAASVILARGRHYAGGFVLAPAARLGEPLLHLVLFREAGPRAVLRALAGLALGRLDRLSEVAIVAARTVSLTGSPDVPLQLDGDPAGHLPVTIGLAAEALLLVQPEAL